MHGSCAIEPHKRVHSVPPIPRTPRVLSLSPLDTCVRPAPRLVWKGLRRKQSDQSAVACVVSACKIPLFLRSACEAALEACHRQTSLLQSAQFQKDRCLVAAARWPTVPLLPPRVLRRDKCVCAWRDLCPTQVQEWHSWSGQTRPCIEVHCATRLFPCARLPNAPPLQFAA